MAEWSWSGDGGVRVEIAVERENVSELETWHGTAFVVTMSDSQVFCFGLCLGP